MFDDLLVVLEELTDFEGQIQGAIPVQYVDVGARGCQVISYNHLGGGEVEGGINREKNDANRISVKPTAPLEYVICTEEERGMGVSVV